MQPLNSVSSLSKRPPSTMSAQVQDQITTATVILCFIAVIGCAGNCTVLLVYARKLHDRQTSTLFIFALAISDSLTCSLLLPYTIVMECAEWRLPSVWVCKLYYFINTMAIFFSSLLISTVAVDRYLCICQPFRKLFNVARVKRLLGVLVLSSLAMGTAAIFQMTLEDTHDSPSVETSTNTSGKDRDSPAYFHMAASSQGPQNFTTPVYFFQCVEVLKTSQNASTYTHVFYHLVQKSQFVCFFVCICIVIALYVLIYRKVRDMNHKRVRLLHISSARRLSQMPLNNLGIDSLPLSPAMSNNNVKEKQTHKQTITVPTSTFLTVPSNSTTVRASLSCEVTPTASANFLQPPNMGVQRRSLVDMLIHRGSTCPTGNEPLTPEMVARIAAREAAFQNFKIAVMLFVVAVVYIVTFLPATLMAMEVIPLYLPVFYLYYVNNAANPIIYSFMNPAFRQEVATMVQECCEHASGRPQVGNKAQVPTHSAPARPLSQQHLVVMDTTNCNDTGISTTRDMNELQCSLCRDSSIPQ